MNKIIKSGGYCSCSCQWRFCDFYKCQEETYECGGKEGFIPFAKKYITRCILFGGIEIIDGSLHCCNQIYGKNYEGRV